MSRMHGTKDFWLGALRSDGPAFRAAAAGADADTAVPTCPEWTVPDLVRHLGAAYAWASEHVVRGVTSAPERTLADAAAAAPPWPATLDWWDAEYARAVERMEATDPEAPAWNPMPMPKKAAFWQRRFAHHTSVHRWDAQVAVGATEPIEAKLAADGISEAMDTLLPGGRRTGPSDREGVVHLAATDVAQEWYVRLRGAGIALLDTGTLLDTDDHHTRVEAVGTASDLLLALYGRVGFDILDVAGDATLLTALRTG
ncbi:MAG TPA: maleylpyruvate isomerase family mycothiol-dependent enzyme [Micromonosporaceae bacterium]|nr:maleylpyruvate isomerase family mycothiol-dependent enzyme [Micromonosporaceae bacterium]